MKVAVLGFNNIKYSPYIKAYTNLLDEHGVEYDVIIPDRNKLHEATNGHLIPIEWDGKKHKLYNVAKFVWKARKILRKEKYDFVFVLTTLPAVLLCHTLVHKYCKKYLVDIRDYTHDKNPIFKFFEVRVLKKAHTRVISSPTFKEFLPDLEYVLCHNFAHKEIKIQETVEKHSDPIKIGYVGSIAYVEECKRLIDLVKDDERFCFYLYGNEVDGCLVSEHAAAAATERIRCFGSYEPAEKGNIISGLDILFNDYGNNSELVRCALSNKLYDAFVFKKPLLTSPKTIMSEMASEYSFDIDQSVKTLDELYVWYHNIDTEKMVAYMNECLTQFKKDNLLFEQKIQEIVGGKT